LIDSCRNHETIPCNLERLAEPDAAGAEPARVQWRATFGRIRLPPVGGSKGLNFRARYHLG
jgi:hypothetical protein